MTQAASAAPKSISGRIEQVLLTPIRAMRLRYLPLLMVYFAYGALGLTAVAETFWKKQALTMSPADLARLAAWLVLPWTIKMVFGQLVDSVPFLGSQRRSYVFLGAALVASGFILLAGAAGGWIRFASLDQLYVIAAMLTVIGVVLQDVVADAMSTEVVARNNPDGSPRPEQDVRQELGMVQVLGRLALSFGMFATAGLAGWLATVVPYEKVFLLGLIVPTISVTGALLVKLETFERKPIDWSILGGGLAFGATVAALGAADVPFAQEFIFLVSMAVVIFMLVRVVQDLDPRAKLAILHAAVVIFAFRATPVIGQGYQWYAIDILGFDEAFMGVLAQIAAALGIAGIWLLSDTVTRQPVVRVLLWLTVLTTVLSVPNIGLVYGVHEWTERVLGFGARTIAITDAAVSSPFAQLSMIPLLTLIAIHAPAGRRATWFALMASLMNLALVAGQLQSKYLNLMFPITRGDYGNLGPLTLTVTAIGFVLPMAAILVVGRRLR